MDRGFLFSGIGHLALILWAMLGDWLFSPQDLPPIEVAEVSLISAAEFDALVASAPKAPEPAPEPVAAPEVEAAPEVAPEPVEDAAAPEAAAPVEPEALPETVPESDTPQPLEAPDPVAPLAEEEQPVPVPESDQRPAPRPIDRVAPTPVDEVTDTPEIAPEATPEVSEEAPPDAPVIEEPEPEAAPEEAATQIVTEAVETEDDAPQLAPTASRRPQSRPVQVAAVEEPVEPQPEDTSEADAIAAAVAAAAASTESEPETGGSQDAPEGPPMTAGELEDMRVAVKECWNLGALSSEAMQVTVTVRLDVSEAGVPDAASIRMTGFEGGGEAAANQMYEVARRAILRCGRSGFPLPPEKYQTWKDLELVFDPNGMRLR